MSATETVTWIALKIVKVQDELGTDLETSPASGQSPCRCESHHLLISHLENADLFGYPKRHMAGLHPLACPPPHPFVDVDIQV